MPLLAGIICRTIVQTVQYWESYIGDGAFAEYVAIPIKNLHVVPDSVSDEKAVHYIEPLAAAFEILEQVKIKSSDRVCVLGDGKLGLLAGQVLNMTRTAI